MAEPVRTILAAVVVAVALGRAGVAQPSGGAKYVSMGSSYAAGPGVGQPVAASGACGRSQSNYAQLLTMRRRLSLVDVACSGATTQDILVSSQNGVPPQINAVDAQTRLVTVTIGGNDVAYMANLFGYSCRDAGGDCAVSPDTEVDDRFAALPASMRKIVNEVRRRAPQARLVLIDYLPVVPAAGRTGCAAVPLTENDGARMRSVAARLAGVIAGVAVETHALVVKSSMIGAGHDACATDPYVAGYKPAVGSGWPRPVGYHPNQRGMQAIAEALDKALPRENSGR
jgi:lysophospholipase L1-like esterase